METRSMTIKREIRNYLLKTNLYPTKEDLDVWKIGFCDENPNIDETDVCEVTCASINSIRMRAHNQIYEYLTSDDAKTRVPDLYNIAQGCREIERTDRSIFLSDVQHMPLAYKTYTGLPSEKSKTSDYCPNFARQGCPIPNNFKGATVSGLFLNAKLASQVFYVVMLHPWKGRRPASFAEQAGITNRAEWNAAMLVAAMSLVRILLNESTDDIFD